MPLAEDITALRDRVLADLNAAHDYYTDTKLAWKIVQRFVDAGGTFAIRNMTTGSVTTDKELSGKARGYVAEQLAEATFQQFITIFESYFFDLLRLWLSAYPGSLGSRMVTFEDVLAASDKDAIASQVIAKELNEILYKRPADWFKYLDEKAKLGCPTPNEVARIAEAKATRDVLVHNRGIANKTYESKADSLARYKEGQRVDVPERYHRETWELLRKVVTDISNAANGKA